MADQQDDSDRTHNPKVIGSNPIPATKEYAGQSRSFGADSSVYQIAIPTFMALPLLAFSGVRGACGWFLDVFQGYVLANYVATVSADLKVTVYCTVWYPWHGWKCESRQSGRN